MKSGYFRNPIVLLCSIVLAWTVVSAFAASDFSLKSATSEDTFKLSEARGKFVVLHFLLKTECPVCLRHTREYGRSASGASDVVHIFIKPDSDEEIKAWASSIEESSKGVPIYRDPDAQLAKSFGIPDGYQFHGENVRYPALVILDKAGKEVFRYVGKNNSDRFTVAQFNSKLAEIRGKEVAAVKEYNLGRDRLAIQGYDPTSYFAGRAEKGKPQNAAMYRGVTYQFASAKNQEAFSANPEKYVPAYGGWCATAMAKGEKVEIDPTNFKVTNGRLFLFFKAFYGNALKDWNKDEANLTANADAHWKRIAGE